MPDSAALRTRRSRAHKAGDHRYCRLEQCFFAEELAGPPPRELKPCGTKVAYQRHLRRGEPPCEACKAAQRIRSPGYYVPCPDCGGQMQPGSSRCRACWNNNRKRSPCGTPAAYQWHLSHGEKVCDPCKEACRRQAAERYAAGGMRRGTCSSCGKPVTLGASSLPQPTCRSCRNGQSRAGQPCAVESCERPVRARGWCEAHYARWLKHRDVQADMPIGGYFNQEKITPQLRHRIKNQARRADILSDPDPWTLTEIAERDHHACGICGEPVDMSLNGLQARGPNIDHLIPLQLSRDDRRINVRLVHRVCNIQRDHDLRCDGRKYGPRLRAGGERGPFPPVTSKPYASKRHQGPERACQCGCGGTVTWTRLQPGTLSWKRGHAPSRRPARYCPCGAPLGYRRTLCDDCRDRGERERIRRYRQRRKHDTCPECGERKKKTSTRCMDCYQAWQDQNAPGLWGAVKKGPIRTPDGWAWIFPKG